VANGSAASLLLAHEARALLMRLSRLQPFAVQMPMVMAASISMPAQTAIESQLREEDGSCLLNSLRPSTSLLGETREKFCVTMPQEAFRAAGSR
jgi:hypothetical protein